MKSLVILCLLLTCVCGLSSHGNDFYIGALRNHQASTDTLYLYVMTQSSSPVGVTVEDYNGVIATGSVTNMYLLELTLSTNLVTISNNYNNRHKGIRVYTDGGVISVLLVNYPGVDTIGEYLAYPVQQLQNVAQYQYYTVSTLFEHFWHYYLSEFLLIGTDNGTTVTVTSPVDLTVPQNTQLSSSPNVTVTAGTSFTFTLHRMQTLLIGMSQVDITGTSITSDKPLTVISGHECGTVYGSGSCEHLTVQIPPTVELGRQFLLSPYGSKPTQYYKIIASDSQTQFNFTCGSGNVTTISLSGAGGYHTLSATGNDVYCSIISNKPISVYQLGASHDIGNIGDAVISYIPPIDQLSSSTTFVSPNIQDEFTSHYINIVATSPDTVLLDGTQLTLSDGWNAIYDDTNNVIGYGTQVQLYTSDTTRTITTQSNTKFYVLVYGYHSDGSSQAYSYVTGFNSSNIIDNTLDLCLVNNGNCEQVCTLVDGSVKCSCMSGYYITNEIHCTDINECSTDNGQCSQLCTNTLGNYSCYCNTGYDLDDDGYNCTDINECSTNNGGCEMNCHNTNGSYYCSCNAGHVINTDHHHCDDINECDMNIDGCNHNCTNTDGSYLCYCMSGYHLTSNGKTCADTNECINNGGCDQICTNTIGSYQCSCNVGYQLYNGNTCIDIDECSNGTNYCEHNCYNINGSYVCDCQPGYQLSNGLTCSDINECDTNNGGCNQVCINQVGSYYCQCNDGFQLSNDNHTCQDINECSIDNGRCEQECSNKNGSYTCACISGYVLDGYNCIDINECSVNNGGCHHTCNNTPGGYYCQCNHGFQDVNGYCIDIDECFTNNGGCEQDCYNTNGSYTCSCYAGYSGGQFCTDINECVLGLSGCVQECVNAVGSYECTCQDGYYIDDDNHTCLDINECTDEIIPCHQRCVNDDGSFHCDCNTGYILSDNGIICEDVNECESRNGGCEQTCINTPGSFYCSCNVGYLLYNDVFCSDINECLNGNNLCSQHCTNTIGSYECTCNDGYYLGNDDHTCLDVDECSKNNGNCQQKCVNEIGSFHCECDQPGYIQSRNASLCILASDTSSSSTDYGIPAIVIMIIAVIIILAVVVVMAVVIIVIIKRKSKSQYNINTVASDVVLSNPLYNIYMTNNEETEEL